MKKKRIFAMFMISLICLTCVLPSFACAAEDEDNGFETFLSLLRAWGTFLARITGSYDSLENISIFSNFARMWHDFMTSDGFSAERFIDTLLKWLGISIMIRHEEARRESYSI